MKKIVTYYKTARDELLKVVFPTKEQIRSAMISVVVAVVVIALFLGLVDLILFASMSKFFGD